MNANMKKMSGIQIMSMCAVDKCPGTEELTFTMEKMSWGGSSLTSFFFCSARKT